MALQLEPPVPPPRRSVSTSCDLHPGETFTGFCAACLRERLSGLDASPSVAAAPGRRSTSAIRSLFSRHPFAAAAGGAPTCSAAAPDLRRCKSFSCGRWGGAAGDEPQRSSCDVRGRSTLWTLFHQDDRERVRDGTAFGVFLASSSAAAAALAAEVQLPPPMCVPEELLAEETAAAEDSDLITPVAEPVRLVVDTTSGEMDTDATAAAQGDVRAMKGHIDLESSHPHHPKQKSPPKDLKEIAAGSFWLAASVFSKKWQKWKQKLKKQDDAASGSKAAAAAAAMPPPEKPSKPSFLRRGRCRGETGSEFAAVGGRRSCDTNPRFSLDAGRMSVDDVAGVSWDEPRASWDGYLFGPGAGTALSRAPPPMCRLPPILSALEDSPAGVVERSDGRMPVNEDSQPEPEFSDAAVPGGSAQTRDYYMDSSSRRRRSLDRASSARRSVELAADPIKPAAVPLVPVPNDCMVSPFVGSSEFYHFHHAEDLLDHHHHRFSTSSLIEDFSASLEAAFHGPAGEKKLPWRWRKAWNLWGLIHRRAAGRRADAEFSATMPVRGGWNSNGRMQRCSSNASARCSFSSNSGGLGSSSRRSWYADAQHVKRRRGEECGVERNRSARYSPGQAADNGMLRFYLTPGRSASGRRTPGRQSFARTVLRLY